jgi:hypothetical protein
MDAFYQSWLERAAVCPAVLACAVRASPDSMAVKTTQAEVSEDNLLELLRGLTDTARVLKQNQLGCDRLCWTLQVGQLYCAIRPDDIMGVLLASFDPGALPEIEQLLAEFQCAETPAS